MVLGESYGYKDGGKPTSWLKKRSDGLGGGKLCLKHSLNDIKEVLLNNIDYQR